MICCCCGFNEKHGIIFGSFRPFKVKSFVCIRCLEKPYLYFPIKRYEKPKMIIQLELMGRLINEG